ncbi:MAG: hypothetical protein M3347_02280 [Armatimonadota bacterium]|nr:hypothetical protein [Armatimonadota bacterium]
MTLLTNTLIKPLSSFWRGTCRCHPVLCQDLASIRRAIFQYDPEPLEVQTAVIAVGSALWVSWLGYRPGGTQGTESAVYRLLTSLFPDWSWAVTFVWLGILQTVALVKNRMAWRTVSAMLSFVVWAFISVLLIVSLEPGPATVIFPVIALSEAWVYLRLTTRWDAVANGQASNEKGLDEELDEELDEGLDEGLDEACNDQHEGDPLMARAARG